MYGRYLLASWGYRAAALGIDVLLATLFGIAVWGIARAGGADGDTALGAGVFGVLLGWPLLMAIPMGLTSGQSIGKRVVSIHVIREDTRPARFWWSVLRDTLCRGLFFFVPLAVLADYLTATGDRRQTLHDKMTGTNVVRGHAYDTRRAPAVVGGIAGLVAVFGVIVAIGAVNDSGRYNGYTAAERDAFVHGCNDGGLEEECGCMFDYLEKHLPHDEFVAFSRRYNKDPEHTHLPPAFLKAGDKCTSSPEPGPSQPTPDGA
jgi:uncharacterized RDD family membrane protein YckC